MTKQDKIQLAVFSTFMLTMIGLVVYNSLTIGVECTFCVR
jgi:hypothetical protein